MKLNTKQQEAFFRAAALCSRAEKSSNKIYQKLVGWELEEEDAELVLEQLKEEKYIDDERYARSYVRDKFKFNKWGKVKIAYLLRGDRISAEIVELALQEIEEEAYRESLFNLLYEKNKSVKAVNQYDRKAKLIRFAQSRGFEMDLIYSVLDKLAE